MQDAALAEPSIGTLEQGLDAAWAAVSGGDLEVALTLYAGLRERFPASPLPFLRPAFALMEAGRFDEADQLLDTALVRFPAAIEVAVDRAWIAHRRRDVPEAAKRWARVRTAFPEHPVGYAAAAVTLREAGDLDAAEALLAEAETRFPDEASVAIERAWLALARRDPASAIQHWDRIRARHPDNWIGYTGGGAALRDAGRLDEADAVLAEAVARFPDIPTPMVQYAQLAAARRDWTEAARRWHAVAIRYPDNIEAIAGQALALREAGRFTEADAVLAAALKRFPDNRHLRIDHAWVAHIGRDWPAAAARWDVVRTHAPDLLDAYVHGASALREAEQPAAAEELLGLALTHFPDLPDPAMEYARLAQRRGDRDAAQDRWQAANARFPDRLEPWIELAWLATHGHRHEEAFALWEQIRTRFPSHPAGFTGGGAAAANAGQTDRAAAMLKEAVQRFPNEPGPLMEQGWFALNQGEPAAAERIFTGVRQRFPDEAAAVLGLARSLRGQQRDAAAASVLRDGVVRFPNFGLLASDLAAMPETVGTEEPPPPPAIEPAPAPKPPVIVRTMPLKLAIIGFHLANQIAQIVKHLPPLRDRVRVEKLDVGVDADTIRAALPAGWLDRVDVYFEESQVGSAQVKNDVRALLPASCDILTFPTSTVRSLWPFHGRDPRLVPEPPVYNGGRYGESDPFAAVLAGSEMTDEALFDTYMEATEAAPLDLDALYAADLARWRADDAVCDVRLASFIDSHFQERCLFTTPHERDTPIVREIVRRLIDALADMGAADAEALYASLDRLLSGWRASKHAVPIHPRIARHFQLAWWSPDMRYRMMGNEFTFRDYILRYIRWSPWLP